MSRDLRPFAQWPKPKTQIAAPSMLMAYWMEASPGVFEPTSDRDSATHVFEADGSGTYTMTPINTAATPARMRVTGSTYLIYGG